MIPEQFIFLRPGWLLAFVPLAFILWRVVRSSLVSRSWEAIVDRQLLPFMLVGNTSARGMLPSVLLGLCGGLAIIALAGPAWEKLPQPVFSTRTALVIALDLSRSMNAADIAPSRLERARFKISDLLAKRAEGQTALLAYAGDAFAVTPLTDDTATIDSQLGALTTDVMPAQGSRTDLAVKMAVDLLKKGGAPKGDILLIADEVDTERALEAAREAHRAGYRLSVLGVGTPEGAPIARSDGGFMTDALGGIIVPKLEEGPMRQLAIEGGGRYVPISLDDSDVDYLDGFFASTIEMGGADVTETEFDTDIWREQGPWLLVILIPLAAFVFRRGYLIALVLVCLPYPRPAEAFDWDSLWLRQDQRAARALDAGDAAKAAELFADPAWKGAAQYRAGDFDGAIRSLEGLEQIENNYNFGNALARKGHYEAAIAMYDKVLAENPRHEDAKYNKELLEKELEQQQQQQNPNQQQEQEQDEQNRQQQQQNPNQQQEQEQDEQNRQQDQQQDEQQQDQEQQDQQQEEQQQQQAQAEMPKDEQQQATEQWLRRIPDDPGGLLRRKFLYQYQQRDHDRDPGEKTW